MLPAQGSHDLMKMPVTMQTGNQGSTSRKAPEAGKFTKPHYRPSREIYLNLLDAPLGMSFYKDINP
jgi:hypothetical protein